MFKTIRTKQTLAEKRRLRGHKDCNKPVFKAILAAQSELQGSTRALTCRHPERIYWSKAAEYNSSKRTKRFSLPYRSSFAAALVFVIFAVPIPIFADEAESLQQDRENQQQQLNILKESIAEIKSWFKQAEEKQSTLTAQLKAAELNISNSLREQKALESEISSTRKLLEKHTREQARQHKALQNQQALLKQELLAAHAMGREQGLKLILNAEDPVNLQRLLTYFDYMNSARTAKIKRSRQLIADLQRTRDEISRNNEKLIDSQNKLTKNQQALNVQRTNRAQALATLKNRLTNRRVELDQLEVDQQQLEDLIQQIEQAIANVTAPTQGNDFAQLKGKLTWPAKGVLSKATNAPSDNELRPSGVFLQTESGESVKAVYHGRVIFADWLRGFGLLLILDHGDNYMSLYGFNQSLLKETGDWVTSNEVIATAGNSGGRSQTGLYFEIRHQGKPSNALSWLIDEPSGG